MLIFTSNVQSINDHQVKNKNSKLWGKFEVDRKNWIF